MISSGIQVPDCEIDGLYHRMLRNASTLKWSACKKCLHRPKKMSLCRKTPNRNFRRCKRLCHNCRNCLKVLHQIVIDKNVDIICPSFSILLDKASRSVCLVCKIDKFSNTKANCSNTRKTKHKSLKQCKSFQYLHQNHSINQCRNCTKCQKGHTFIYKKCNRNRDTRCKECSVCKPGYYVRKKCALRHDTRCARCPGEDCLRCSRGKFKSITNSSSTCLHCPSGTYMNKKKHFSTSCKPCRRCRPHEKIVQVCNTTHDTICGSCLPGFYRLPSTHNCAMCLPCPPNSTGLVVEECRQGANTRRMCRPPTPQFDPRLLPPTRQSTSLLASSLKRSFIRSSQTTSTSENVPRQIFQTFTDLGLDKEEDVEIDSKSKTPDILLSTAISGAVIFSAVLLSLFAFAIFVRLIHNSKPRTSKTKDVSVSEPTLFSTNSITDYFDISVLYEGSIPKYSSDPEVHKADLRNISETMSPHRVVGHCKSRSLGTVDLMEVEFWRNR